MLDGIIYSLQRHGGITVYFNELLRRLASQNFAHRTVVYAGASDHALGLPSLPEVRKSRIAERYRRCQVPVEARLFHSSYYRLPDIPIPTVTTVHDFTYERFSTGLRRWVHSKQKFDAIRGSQAVICISENTRRDLLQFLPEVDPARVHVIYNGVGEAFTPIQLEQRRWSKRPTVLFVGARGGYKHFATLVSALALLPDLGLLCVGGGPLDESERLAVERALPHRFEHRSGVTEQALNAIYNEAFCLAYPSAYEGFGIPLLEAMRAGCPVIAVNGSSIPEVAGDAALLLDRPGVDELVSALKQLQDTELRASLRRKGFEQASHFSWEKMFEETLRVYEIVGGTRLRDAV